MNRTTACVCGALLRLVDADSDYPGWVHDAFGVKGCTEPAPAAGRPTKSQRDELAQLTREMSGQLHDARSRTAELTASLDAATKHVSDLAETLAAYEYMRRIALNQAWDRLTDAGEMKAAAIVMRMIGGVE